MSQLDRTTDNTIRGTRGLRANISERAGKAALISGFVILLVAGSTNWPALFAALGGAQ